MKIWECEIVEKGKEEYLALKGDGWEPHQFTLIPVPKEAQLPGGLLTANGKEMGASFVQIVMMRKQFDVPTGAVSPLVTDEDHAAFERELTDHD